MDGSLYKFTCQRHLSTEGDPGKMAETALVTGSRAFSLAKQTTVTSLHNTQR